MTAGRFADWAGAGLGDGKASHVERLFNFVLEQRSRCDTCGDSAATAVRYGFDRVLRLPVPESTERGRVWTTTELYYARASRRPRWSWGAAGAAGGRRTASKRAC